MKITYDPEVDALYIRFLNGPAEVTTRRLTDDVAFNYGPDGCLAGIEILDASEYGFRLGEEQTVVVHNLATSGA